LVCVDENPSPKSQIQDVKFDDVLLNITDNALQPDVTLDEKFAVGKETTSI